MQIKTLQGVPIEFKEVEGKPEFSGYVALFNVPDESGDIIHKRAFDSCLADAAHRKRIKILWQNDIHEPIGKPIELKADATGLFLTGRLSSSKMANNAYMLIKDGILTDLGMCFDVLKSSNVNGHRVIEEIRLWAISLVTFGQDSKAVITDVKRKLAPQWQREPIGHNINLKGELDYFILIEPEENIKELSEIIKDAVCQDLGITKDIDIRFYREETFSEASDRIIKNNMAGRIIADKGANAWTSALNANEIFIDYKFLDNADDKAKALVKAISHELAHVKIYNDIPEIENRIMSSNMKALSEGFAKKYENKICSKL